MKLDPEFTRERIMWLAVIRLAQADANGEGFAPLNTQHLAQRWLVTPHLDFSTVCSHAGLTQEQTKLLQDQERRKWIATTRIN